MDRKKMCIAVVVAVVANGFGVALPQQPNRPYFLANPVYANDRPSTSPADESQRSPGIRYKTWTDPSPEHAWSLEVPADWQAAGGTSRITGIPLPLVRLSPPDKSVLLFCGDARISGFQPPSAFYPNVGTLVDTGIGSGDLQYGTVKRVVQPYMPGAKFAAWYLQQLHYQLDPNKSHVKELSAATAQQLGLPVPGAEWHAGILSFEATFEGTPIYGWILTVTMLQHRSVPGVEYWGPSTLIGYITPYPDKKDLAGSVLKHCMNSFRTDPNWLRNESANAARIAGMSARDAEQMTQSIVDHERQRQKTMDNVVDDISHTILETVDLVGPDGHVFHNQPDKGEYAYYNPRTRQMYWTDNPTPPRDHGEWIPQRKRTHDE
jgi:hypothetical protein